MLPIVINILLVILVLVSLLIVLLTLMQRPKNEGLGATFGGGMTENLFGSQTTNVLQTITWWLGGLLFGLTLLLSYLYVKKTQYSSPVQQGLQQGAAVAPAVAPPTPEAPAATLPDATAPAGATPAVDAAPAASAAPALEVVPAAPAPAK